MLQFSGWSVFLRNNWDTATFVTNYLPLALFPIMYFSTRYWYRCTLIKPEDMDFLSGLAEIEADCYDEPEPRNWVERFWAWLVSSDHFSAANLVSDRLFLQM